MAGALKGANVEGEAVGATGEETAQTFPGGLAEAAEVAGAAKATGAASATRVAEAAEAASATGAAAVVVSALTGVDVEGEAVGATGEAATQTFPEGRAGAAEFVGPED